MHHTFLVLAAAVTLPLGLSAQQKSVYTPGALNAYQQIAHDIYKELIEINTGVTTGNVTTAAVAMAKRFRDAGIPEADIFVGGPRPEKYNVVARIRGRSSARKPLLLLAHLDVVEALKSDWSPDLDPFVFTERDGYYYGRGTADDKAMAAIFVANVFRMKREGWVPDRDIVIALTADEESGPANGVDWLLKSRRELVDAALVINEGGGGVLRNGKPLYNGVQATEKVTTNFTLRVTNRGGHSSVPREDNAITALADALSKIGPKPRPPSSRRTRVTTPCCVRSASPPCSAVGTRRTRFRSSRRQTSTVDSTRPTRRPACATRWRGSSPTRRSTSSSARSGRRHRRRHFCRR
jgi:hypothetical protein